MQAAVAGLPAGARKGGRTSPVRQGVVLASPRRTSELGRPAVSSSEWGAPSFTLDTPYPIATADSRFADYDEDAASLAAVAHSAGSRPAVPTAGLSTDRKNTHGDLPSLRAGMRS